MKIGLLVDPQLSREAKYLLMNLDISKVYVQQFKTSRRTIFKLNILSKILFKIISAFENIFFKSKPVEHYSDVKPIKINLMAINSHGRYYVNKKDIQKIKNDDLDVLVRCGSGILSGEILNVCEYGIISLHHGDISFMRGRPSGFYEHIFRRPDTGFIIQKLTETLDGGEIIFKGSITTTLPWTLNYDRVYNRSLHYLKLILSSKKNLLLRDSTLPYSGPNYSTPSVFYQFLYLKTILIKFSRFLYNRLNKQRYFWSVYFLRKDSLNGVNLNKGIRLVPRKNSWLADPFSFNYEGKDYIFLEDFKVKDNKAVISVYEIIGNKQQFIGECINESFHLSFPRILRYKEKLFLTLESADKKGIRIYVSNSFPLKWSYSHSILNEYYCGDPIIYHEENKLILLVNIAHNINDFNTDLFKFNLNNNLTSYELVSELPLISSPRGGRNAGLAKINGKIMRIGQVQGYLHYGKSLVICNLESQEIEDEIVLHDDCKYFGIHTLNSSNGIYVYDMAKYRKLNSSY